MWLLRSSHRTERTELPAPSSGRAGARSAARGACWGAAGAVGGDAKATRRGGVAADGSAADEGDAGG
eukprot:4387668-Pleurochrysis_carterae.AAC.1